MGHEKPEVETVGRDAPRGSGKKDDEHPGRRHPGDPCEPGELRRQPAGNEAQAPGDERPGPHGEQRHVAPGKKGKTGQSGEKEQGGDEPGQRAWHPALGQAPGRRPPQMCRLIIAEITSLDWAPMI